MKQSLLLTLVLALLGFALPAQDLAPEAVSSSGGYDTGAGVSLSWTLGEISTETYAAGTAILTQGFHQTALGPNAVTESEIGLELLLFPNPASETIFLRLDEEAALPLRLHICNSEGKVFWAGNLANAEGAIHLNGFPNGLYILSLWSEDGGLLGAVKFLKSN
jgi:hypothetical protein